MVIFLLEGDREEHRGRGRWKQFNECQFFSVAEMQQGKPTKNHTQAASLFLVLSSLLFSLISKILILKEKKILSRAEKLPESSLQSQLVSKKEET